MTSHLCSVGRLRLGRAAHRLLGWLAVLAVLTPVILLAGAPSAQASTGLERQFLSLVNQERTSRGLPALELQPALSDDLSRPWSAHMASSGQLGHSGSGQQILEGVQRLLPTARRAGENVGFAATVEQLHEALMDSPGHRSNILSSGYDVIGLGVAEDGSRVWVTQTFAGLERTPPQAAPPPPPAAASPAPAAVARPARKAPPAAPPAPKPAPERAKAAAVTPPAAAPPAPVAPAPTVAATVPAPDAPRPVEVLPAAAADPAPVVGPDEVVAAASSADAAARSPEAVVAALAVALGLALHARRASTLARFLLSGRRSRCTRPVPA